MIPRVMACLCLGVIGSIPGGGAGGGEDVLSPEETIAVAFLDGRTDDLVLRCFSKANPAAREAVLKLVSNKDADLERGRLYLLLGHVGEAGDVPVVERVIREASRKESDPKRFGVIMGAMGCLGAMCRRQIPEARTLMDKWSTVDYWKSAGIVWGKGDASGTSDLTACQAVWLAVKSYAMTGNEDGERLLKQALKDARFKEHMSKAKIEDLTRELVDSAKAWRDREGKAVTAEERAALRRRFSEMKHLLLGKAANPDDVAYVKRTVAEAREAFTALGKLVIDEKWKDLAGHLMDDGKVVTEERARSGWQEFEKDLAREKPIILAVGKLGQWTATNCQVTEAKTYRCQSIDARGEPANLSASSDLTVVFRISGSAEIGRTSLPDNRGSMTVADDGTLIVVMRRIDGKWYWNPFGW